MSQRHPFHPRNRHQGRYDFPRLIQAEPQLAGFVIRNPYGHASIDFANPDAVRVFNQALLADLYGVKGWHLPEGYLCPPIPGRADYIHGVADVLTDECQGDIPRGAAVSLLDVGTGANCIYPLLAHLDYGWRVVAADIDTVALASAQRIVEANQLQAAIVLRHQARSEHCFTGIIQTHERFYATVCNPPFHASAAEAASGSRRKWRNLGKQDPSRRLPTLNFGGQSNELWCKGGELAFVRRMIQESRAHTAQVLWFTSLLSKKAHLRLLQRTLEQVGAAEVRLHTMAQGQKQSRFLAWTFHDQAARQQWLVEAGRQKQS